MAGTNVPSPLSIEGADVARTIDVTITSAQVLALNATPVQVIAAPGANKAIVIDSLTCYKSAGTAYAAIAAGDDLQLRYTDGSGTILSGIEMTGFADQTTAQTRIAPALSAVGTVRVELTPTANAKVVAYMATGEITTGTSPFKLRIQYRVLDTVLY